MKNVRNIVHQAFWDLLEKDVAADPPQYGNAMKLLKEMKQVYLMFELISLNMLLSSNSYSANLRSVLY